MAHTFLVRIFNVVWYSGSSLLLVSLNKNPWNSGLGWVVSGCVVQVYAVADTHQRFDEIIQLSLCPKSPPFPFLATVLGARE